MFIQPTEQHLAAMQTYGALLQEIRGRIWLADNLIIGDKGVNSFHTREFCYLQLRMICELIALGCLVAHGDIKETKGKSFQKEKSPGNIIKMMENLHPDFYPIPMTMWKTGPTQWDQKEILDGFLTKSDVIALYNRCGDNLHRASLKKFKSSDIIVRKDFPIIREWLAKAVKLLQSHRMQLLSGDGIIYCNLVNSNKPDEVFVIWGGKTA